MLMVEMDKLLGTIPMRIQASLVKLYKKRIKLTRSRVIVKVLTVKDPEVLKISTSQQTRLYLQHL